MSLGRSPAKTRVVAFLQDKGSLPPIVRALRKRGLYRSATIHAPRDRRDIVGSWIGSPALGWIIATACIVIIAVVGRLSVARVGTVEMLTHALAIVASVIVGGWAIARLLDVSTAMSLVRLHRRWLVQGESVVVVSAPADRAPDIIEVVSEVVGEHPAIFVLHPAPDTLSDPVHRVHPAQGEEAIHHRAVRLASELKDVKQGHPEMRSLVPRIDECERTLRRVQRRLSGAVQLEEGIALSAEWVLDNAYVVQGHIEDFRRNLPTKFYRELPFVVSGPRAGSARVYCIAAEMVALLDGRLTRDGIQSFLQTFQSQTTLSTGELWALPMMLRLRLIEYLATLCVEVERRQSESEVAALWANRLLYTARLEPGRVPELIAAISSEWSQPSPHIVEELLSHLYDEEAAITPVRSWLQSRFPSPLEEVVRQDEQLETADQISLANSISTLRLLSQIDWRDVFEAVSHVEATLWTDPAMVYGRMDFETRDRYRRMVEEIAKRRGITEESVAKAAVELGRKEHELHERHVGYYLIDNGRDRLLHELGARAPLRWRLRAWSKRHAATVYISSITCITVLLVAFGLYLCRARLNTVGAEIVLTFLLALPAAALAVQTVNYLVTRTLKPCALPKMNFLEGIPEQFRTLVVVPTMLLTPDSIRDEVERLEIRALANPDPNLVFGLLSDFSDAPQQHMPGDLELLEVAVRGLEELNRKHGSNRFLLFHRDREWSDDGQCWMGWERKRGKLEALTRLLAGELDADKRIMIPVGSAETVQGTVFVITLDSDTQLPRGTAHRMVATLAHPLNRPILSEDGRSLLRGYTIIQPRVSTSLPSATASIFTLFFTDATGIDPYTHAVADVYQDLAGSGSYHGKGIYEVAAFNRLLRGRFPEAHLLSHDLIEGAYVGVGLASDIELLDLFPETYAAYCIREHRWIRGDWQVIDWLRSRVPTANGQMVANTLPAIERWKILDNLRRSLTPAAVVAMLVLGCAVAPRPGACALLFCFVVLDSALFPILTRLTQRWKLDPVVWREPGLNLIRCALFTVALPHQAWLSLNAIARVLYRRNVSRRNLLEWDTSVRGPKAGTRRSWSTVARLAWAPLFAVVATVIVLHAHPRAWHDIVPFAFMWAASPLILAWLDTPIATKEAENLSSAERSDLRRTARQTWRFFDEFVGPPTNWLPPDNFQEMLRVELAARTSPTNIGLYLLSVLAAHDLGYITPDQAIERILCTLKTIHGLERFRGHLLNWYETDTLKPLGDPYVSSVDSGNLMGCLWALEQGLHELIDRPLVGPRLFRGLSDALALFREADGRAADSPEARSLREALESHPTFLFHITSHLEEVVRWSRDLSEEVSKRAERTSPSSYWAERVRSQAEIWEQTLKQYCSWAEPLSAPPELGLLHLGTRAHGLRRKALTDVPSIRALAEGSADGVFELLSLLPDREKMTPELAAWVDRLTEEAQRARTAACDTMSRAEAALALIRQMDDEMEMSFLYDPQRKLFSIGYNVSDQRLDRSYYDLLASECRLGSFLAIARGDVPTDHWWALGRPFGFAYLRRPLLSWTGTMFEYLMPLLLTRNYTNSLLDQSCKTAVVCQIKYARQRGIPWGISESAFSALDGRQVYQYQAFGIPALALKRGLEEDFVVAPYATALALSVEPRLAARNLSRRGPLAKAGLLGNYGFYESIDYTRQRGPRGERGLVVYTYMAHHQGMLLLAICNALENDVMQKRFHADPRVVSTASLLYERVPVAPPLVKSYPRETPVARLEPITGVPATGRIDTPHTATPRTCLLANGEYRVMVTNAGGGYSKWQDFDISRWRSDTTCDDMGKFCYLKDVESGYVWSAAHHPIGTAVPQRYRVVFSADKAEFRRRDRGIETVTEITVCPEDNAEIWQVTLINRSQRPRTIELTSYIELALAPHNADRAHPAFSKMFVETAMVRDLDALLAWRRVKSQDEPPIWVAHILASQTRSHEPTPFETDRAKFIGRGRSVRNPIALEDQLTCSEGYVLDPILSIRKRVTIEPGQRVEVTFVTCAAATRDQVMALAAKYRDQESATRAFQLAWTNSQLELRHLRIKPPAAQLYQELAGRILYPHAHSRAPSERLLRNRLGQQHLWGLGISGDLPIMVVSISEPKHEELVQEVLAAHTFWRVRGLMCDLVILNEEAASYDQLLQGSLQRIIAARSLYTGVDQPGGVFLRPAKQIGNEDLTLLLACAHVVLVGARGPLAQQIGQPVQGKTPVLLRGPRPNSVGDEPSQPLPFLELSQFNGLGGFTSDSREYAVYLDKRSETPRPWSNVIANPTFGTLVTDEGSGFTWQGNSQSHKLTPWSNDPVSNPSGEAIYIHDPALNALWTPTPLPIREDDPYRTRHGQGYTICEHNSHAIDQELTTFVPPDASVKIQRLVLRNRSTRRRTLSITYFAELVLAATREESQLHVVTNWDLETKSIFARNAYNETYSNNVAFLACNLDPESFTADRTEVLGRNGSVGNPVGARASRLSGRSGGGLDPCAALRIQVQLEPNDSSEIVFMLGAAQIPSEARELIRRFRAEGEVDRAFQAVRDLWDTVLGATRVETPEKTADLMLNRWLPYQVLSCRYWGRSAFYQSGGAFGFRDQLQDCLALLYSRHDLVREHILRSAARQFPEGDVQHWWHEETGAGVRTRISDDLLWLPFATFQYVRVTGDRLILTEEIPFLEGRLLDKGEHDSYFTPTVSSTTASLLEHCKRAIAKSETAGPHGIPLIGGGDWNDGLNMVGIAGKGESVWLGWFLIDVLRGFSNLLESEGDRSTAAAYRQRSDEIATAIEQKAWDGAWYRRAFFDDGTPMGSKGSPEAKIDSIAQSWAAISRSGAPERVNRAMRSVNELLVDQENSLIKLFTPPFNTSVLQPGYIKGYPPGVRENGGQYTQGSLWSAMAWARMGNGNEAVRLLQMMNPVSHSSSPESVQRYMVEPYVVVADVYTLDGRVGMGGWSWYTGSAAWMYRIWLEDVLGFKLRGDRFTMEPVIPTDWPGFKLTYRFRSSTYAIEVLNGQSSASVELDGAIQDQSVVRLVDDGHVHQVRVCLARKTSGRASVR